MTKRDAKKIERIGDTLYKLGTKYSPSQIADFIICEMAPEKAGALVYMLPRLAAEFTFPTLDIILRRRDEDEV